MKKFMKFLTLALVGLFIFMSVGCSKGGSSAKKKITLIYVEWSSEIASTHVVAAILKDKLGYDVKLLPVSAAAMWKGIASGDADGMVAAWLPTTHGDYLNNVKDKVVNLGPNLKGTKIGLVVPTYVTIKSIEELKANASKFDGKIIGIDPGAGLMKKTEKVLKDYGLDNMKLIEGSGAAMTAALKEAIRNKKWIVVTGWTPHWKFAKWDLKYLEDPKKIYGGEEFIGTIVKKGLKEEKPDAYMFLDKFEWTPKDMAQVMIWNQEKGSDPWKTARRWIKENPEKVKKWLEK